MRNRIIILTIMMFVASAWQHAEAADFTTTRLQKLAGYVSLSRLNDQKAGSVSNQYAFRQHPLTVRKNRWGEVEHIGLLLFPQSLRTANPSPVYDFLERYLLERLVVPAESEQAFLMMSDGAHFGEGSASTALKVDTMMDFSEEYVGLKVYRVGWSRNGKTLLKMSFPMDYQMMTGCNLIELEKNFERDLRRSPKVEGEVSLPEIDTSSMEYTMRGGNYMIKKITGDIYLTKDKKGKKGKWTLVSGRQRPVKAMANMMVCPFAAGQLQMELMIDMYGFRTDSLSISYAQWMKLCMDEGCKPYFGVKGKRGTIYQTCVFMVNEKGGYVHLLSIDMPEESIEPNSKVAIKGRMRGYIPLHNVDADLLNPDDYQNVNN